MAKHNASNERIKREYFHYLKEARRRGEASIDASAILIARERQLPSTIAELYDPKVMPENLREAHRQNDEVVERIYFGRLMKNDSDRLEGIFALYRKAAGR